MWNGAPLYLRSDVQVEPLMDGWYVWSHLVPPHTAARNITERHLKIMDSYISAPQVHASAVKNPKLMGGPFIDHGGKRVDEIKALRDRIKQKREPLIRLSSAITELDELLRNNARGFSMVPLYNSIPPMLRGYVELVYDLNHHPRVHYIEPLLYRSPLYDRGAQSIAMSLTKGDDRPFVLSTPRLPSDDLLELELPFESNILDDMFRLKRSPRTWKEVRELLPIGDREEELFASFFTTEKPAPYQPYTGKGVRWRYFGHACILIETGGLSFLFDPVLSYTYESSVSRYTYDHLPEVIDYVLVTHNHQDHILFETLLQLRHRVRHVVVPKTANGALQDPSVKLTLEAVGFRNVIELGDLEQLPIENGSITAFPFFGEHCDLDVRSKLAYMVRAGRHSMLFATDSCNIEPALYEHLHREFGNIDALFVGMECIGAPLSWLYGPLLTRKIDRGMDESRRLAGSNFQQAVNIVDRFKCKEVYVYAMGQEPWLNHIMSLKYTEESLPIVESNKLINDCNSRGITAERLFGEREILLEP